MPTGYSPVKKCIFLRISSFIFESSWCAKKIIITCIKKKPFLNITCNIHVYQMAGILYRQGQQTTSHLNNREKPEILAWGCLFYMIILVMKK